ncbi:hypothetical protein ACFQDL_32620 [Marinobacterium aestuariivivens]|uniref:Uncharacterized protein n=1 Tax=Marinobacterium aestuariivivens TaxID=1698799 RepID=A0ABW2AA65_9GAMM
MVLLALLVGLIPDLVIGAIKDLYGPCGFSDEVCHEIQIQGAIQAIFAAIFAMASVVVAFLVSKDIDGGDEK